MGEDLAGEGGWDSSGGRLKRRELGVGKRGREAGSGRPTTSFSTCF